MNTKKELFAPEIKKTIDELSTDFILTDAADADALTMVLHHFTKLHEWASDISETNLSSVLEAAKQILVQIKNKSISQPEFWMDIIGHTITAIQYYCSGKRSFYEAQFPEELCHTPQNNVLPNSTARDLTPDKNPAYNAENDTHAQPHPSKEGTIPLRHPDKLPEHLDHHLFAEFLSLQGNVLTEIEALLLNLEKSTDAEHLIRLKRLFHNLKGEAGFFQLAEIEKLCHSTEDLIETSNPRECIDLLLKVKDWLKTAFDSYALKGNTPEPVDALLQSLKTAQKTADTVPIFPMRRKEDKLLMNQQSTIQEFVNVNAERLDRIVDTIGELVITESMLNQSVDLRTVSNTKIHRHLNQLSKITRELQELGLSLRMVPIKAVFQKMERIVRDLSKKSGKPITFSMSGEDTELDKTVIEKIADPLMHIVRNAIDHGIETSIEERITNAKPESGSIEMFAYHKGGYINIEVKDDGRGIDSDKIKKKAMDTGLIAGDEPLSNTDIYQLIFSPGFSTAQLVTDVSGRGVGMDVVKNNIEALHGKIDIKTTPGKSSTFILRIPLTLAIIDGMIIRVRNERYIIPTLSIISSTRLDTTYIKTVWNKGEMITHHSQLIPIFRLHQLFALKSPPEQMMETIVIIVEEDKRRIAVLVDEIIGKQQIVIKTLGNALQYIKGIAGGAIMPDGRIALILDINGIINTVYHNNDTTSLSLKKRITS